MFKRTLVCFDGTGNSNQVNTSDTIIIKLYQRQSKPSIIITNDIRLRVLTWPFTNSIPCKHGLGVLSKGNKEIIPFVCKCYQDYETGQGPMMKDAHQKYMDSFKRTFGRVYAKEQFLGLFDKFYSLRNFDVPFTRPKFLLEALSKADHILYW